jgi:hypothetical protein
MCVAGQLSRFIKCFEYIICSPQCPPTTCYNSSPDWSPVADLRTLKHTISPPRSPKRRFFFNYYGTRRRTEILRLSSESWKLPLQNYESCKKNLTQTKVFISLYRPNSQLARYPDLAGWLKRILIFTATYLACAS